MRFSTREYSQNEKISREARFEYIPLNTQVREDVVNKIKLTELEL